MKYPPKHHQDSDRNHIIEVIKAYPLATIMSVVDNTPLVTHLPLIYENGKLIGHIDIYNPQTELLKNNNDITVLFYGPQCYISPSIYSTTQLPTYNYIRVHLKGKVTEIEDKNALKQSLITMTEFLENPNPKYTLEPDNPRLDANLSYIKMFEIDIPLSCREEQMNDRQVSIGACAVHCVPDLGAHANVVGECVLRVVREVGEVFGEHGGVLELVP